MIKYNNFETAQIHAKETDFIDMGARNMPIYYTGAFALKEFKRLDFDTDKYVYTRVSNPTVALFEEKITLLEGGYKSIAVSSGMAAIYCALCAVAVSGENIIVSKLLNGGVYNMIEKVLSRSGIIVKYFDPDNILELDVLIDNKTKAVYFDTIGNPYGNIPDFECISDLCHKKDVLVIVDNTIASPYFFNPIMYNADIVLHSTAKYICGNSFTMGGIITIGDGVCGTETRTQEIYKSVKETVQYVGACMSPFNAHELLCSLETLGVRMKEQSRNTYIIAEYLRGHQRVGKVFYAALKEDRYYGLAAKYFKKGLPPLLGFMITGERKDVYRFMEELKLISHQINFGDVKSLIMFPLDELYDTMPVSWKKEYAINESFLRLSVGLEHVDDLIADIDQAFSKIY